MRSTSGVDAIYARSALGRIDVIGARSALWREVFDAAELRGAVINLTRGARGAVTDDAPLRCAYGGYADTHTHPTHTQLHTYILLYQCCFGPVPRVTWVSPILLQDLQSDA